MWHTSRRLHVVWSCVSLYAEWSTIACAQLRWLGECNHITGPVCDHIICWRCMCAHTHAHACTHTHVCACQGRMLDQMFISHTILMVTWHMTQSSTYMPAEKCVLWPGINYKQTHDTIYTHFSAYWQHLWFFKIFFCSVIVILTPPHPPRPPTFQWSLEFTQPYDRWECLYIKLWCGWVTFKMSQLFVHVLSCVARTLLKSCDDSRHYVISQWNNVKWAQQGIRLDGQFKKYHQ